VTVYETLFDETVYETLLDEIDYEICFDEMIMSPDLMRLIVRSDYEI
jgi:hypothetical protein